MILGVGGGELAIQTCQVCKHAMLRFTSLPMFVVGALPHQQHVASGRAVGDVSAGNFQPVTLDITHCR